MRITYRSAENILRLTLDADDRAVRHRRDVDGILDIAEQGRLIGLEIPADGHDLHHLFEQWSGDSVASRYLQLDDDSIYIALSTPNEQASSMHVRAADVHLSAEVDEQQRLVALGIPRRGHGYEISYPSGNQ